MSEDYSHLKRRLDLLRQALAPAQETAAEPPPATFTSLERFLQEAGWQKVGGCAWSRRLTREAPALPEEGESPLLCASRLPGRCARDLLFFDLETTGLSSGTGSSIFLTGLAWVEGPRLVLEQHFLADFPGEPEYLAGLRERFSPDRVLVSYNGRAFDAQLIRTRFLMNGLSWEPGDHLDLLHWSRRLWRRTLGDCSLANIERRVLGVARPDDVPGWEIPDIYFGFLRSGRPERLGGVFEHNLQDLLSLARLFTVVEGVLSSRRVPETADRLSLGRWLLAAEDPRGLDLLAAAYAAGELQAGLALGLHHKRVGDWAAALALWTELAENRRSLPAAVELAKYYEHRARDVRAALGWVERCLGWGLPLPAPERAELGRRLARLRRRLERVDGSAEERERPEGPAPGGTASDGMTSGGAATGRSS